MISSPLLRRLLVVGFVAFLTAHSVRAEAQERVQLGTASFEMPQDWESEAPISLKINSMPAEIAVIASGDGRVSVFLIVIDPFGIDIEDWNLLDLLGPTVVDLLALNGADPSAVRVRRSRCVFGGEERPARLIVFPAGDDANPRLYAGLGCGIEEANRWAAAFVIVESQYDRPLLLQQQMLDANHLLESFSFD